jgi:UDPglucose 6-dehydrogenase
MRYVDSEYDAAQGADALLILTDWSQFGELDLIRLHSALHYPIVIDGRNLYNPQTMIDHDFTYISVGRPAVYPLRKTAPTETH